MDSDKIYEQGNEAFRDRLTTITADGKRNWVYAIQPKGKFTTYRNYINYLFFAIFFIMPLIQVNGKPFFMINFASGEFILFSKVFWPEDFFIFAVGMITFIIFIVLFTVMYGRVFCGWVCPQTVFMEGLFRKIEWWIEGSASQQRKLNAAPWTTDKVIKKTLKHGIFLIVSFLIANTFLAYIFGLKGLIAIIREPVSEHLLLFSGVIVFTAIFYTVFAFIREIVCTTICPYGRLQGVMFDKDTMQVAYDYKRGEPRGKMVKNDPEPKGDCIDCKKCVIVCPTGIDIRDGVQMECVGCTACIDECDDVMVKIGRPTGLIRYASENQIVTGKPFHFTPRLKAYTVVLALLLGVMTYLIATNPSIDTHISRVKGQLFQELPDDKISNLYNAKIINKTIHTPVLEFKVEGIPGEVNMVGNKEARLKNEALNDFVFFIIIDAKHLTKRSNDIKVGVYADGEKIQTIDSKFLGPFK